MRNLRVIDYFKGKYCEWNVKSGDDIAIFPNSVFCQGCLLQDTTTNTVMIAGWQSIDPDSIKSIFNERKIPETIKNAYNEGDIVAYTRLVFHKYGLEIDVNYINRTITEQSIPLYPVVFEINDDGAVVSVVCHGAEAYEIWSRAMTGQLNSNQNNQNKQNDEYDIETDTDTNTDDAESKNHRITRKLKFVNTV